MKIKIFWDVYTAPLGNAVTTSNLAQLSSYYTSQTFSTNCTDLTLRSGAVS
jgi:hypothetical protein